MTHEGLILVVDDEDDIREVAAEILQMVGYETLCAASGQDAIALFRQHHADVKLTLLDMQMPGMDGAETYDKLQEIDEGVKVLFSSGYSNLEVSRQLPGVGADDFLSKPYDFNLFITKVGEALQG